MQVTRKRDITIGLLFISAFPLYGIGSSLLETPPSDNASDEIESSSSSNVAGIGLLMVLANSIVVLMIGRMLKHIVAPIDKSAADIYFHARLLEALLLAFSAILVFFNHQHEHDAAAISEEIDNSIAPWGYRAAMIGLGMGSFPLLIALRKEKMIPAWLSWSGVVGYFCVIVGILADISGAEDLGMYFMIPGAFFEITFAVWLIVYGFTSDGGYENLS